MPKFYTPPPSLGTLGHKKLDFWSALRPPPSLLTVFYAGGGIYAPTTTYRQFSPDILIQGGSKYTQHLSFINAEHLKLVSGQK